MTLRDLEHITAPFGFSKMPQKIGKDKKHMIQGHCGQNL